MSRVAVLGLGAMGSRVAGRLLAAGHDVVVWNRTTERVESLVELGARAAVTPADAAAQAEAVITMVSEGQALAAVLDGSEGAFAGSSPGTTLIQMATIGPAALERVAASLPSGVEMLDAPVLGSTAEAEAGSLVVFAGGDEDLIGRWTPLLSALGTVLHVGPLASGSAAKLVANSTLFVALAGLGEALALADALELSRHAAFEVLAKTPLAAQAERRRPAIESGEYPLRFTLRLASKDAELIGEAAAAAGLKLRAVEAAAVWLDEAAADNDEADYSSVLATILGRAVA